MPTITTLAGAVVVLGSVLGLVVVYVQVLARLATRHNQALRVDLDARRLRLNVQVDPKQERSPR